MGSASRLEGTDSISGHGAHLSRPTNRSPSDAGIAATANAVGAEPVVSLRCAGPQTSLATNGVASFTSATRFLRLGVTYVERVAPFVQREVSAHQFAVA